MTRGLAVVTGGSGGIGSAICARLASDGYTVIVGWHSAPDRADNLLPVLSGARHRTEQSVLSGARHRSVRIATDEAESLVALTQLVSDMCAEHGIGLEVLVNCAGVTEPVAHDDLDALTDDLIDRIFSVNWKGPFATIRALRPELDKADGAVVINISSIAGVTGQGSNVAYCASKAALDSMTRSLGRALGPSIRVVSVSPGWVLGEYAERMDPAMLATQQAATPLDRLATADDVAAAVSAVANDLPFTTGSIISVDGGRPLGTS